jgi:hypothetical protein
VREAATISLGVVSSRHAKFNHFTGTSRYWAIGLLGIIKYNSPFDYFDAHLENRSIAVFSRDGRSTGFAVASFISLMYSLVSISFSRNNKNVSLNTDCDRLSGTYSYVSHGMRRLVSFMFCVLQASCGVRMVVQSFRTTRAILPSPKHI